MKNLEAERDRLKTLAQTIHHQLKEAPTWMQAHLKNEISQVTARIIELDKQIETEERA